MTKIECAYETFYSPGPSTKQKMAKNRRLTIDALVIVFGISAWISVNGLWVELPLLVDKLPEGWNLPSYLVMITQIANIGPLIFGILLTKFPERVNETCTSYIVLIVGIIASIFLIFFWDNTTIVNGVNHSVGLFITWFFLSMVDTTSSVTFLPFMGLFKPQYLTPYLVGEGLSGLLPAVVSLGQGVGGNPDCKNVTDINVTDEGNLTEWHMDAVYSEPRFSVEAFFIFVLAMMVASTCAFVLLNCLPVGKSERNIPEMAKHASSKDKIVSLPVDVGMDSTRSLTGTELGSTILKIQPGQMTPFTYWYLLAIQTFLSLLIFGFLFSLQSYSCLPYGNTAYHLTVTLSNVANPAASFIAIFIVPTSVTVITVHSIISILIAVYILVLAVLSPAPPLVGNEWGSALVIIAWIFCIGLSTYAKAGIANMMRTQGKRALFWVGSFTQIGALVGAIISFLLINVYELFESYYPCI